jgi:pilus assembly protein Flp/PilA
MVEGQPGRANHPNSGLGSKVMKFVSKLLKNSKGATAIEYGLIAALIAVAAITAMTSLGNQLQKTFSNVSNNMKAS